MIWSRNVHDIFIVLNHVLSERKCFQCYNSISWELIFIMALIKKVQIISRSCQLKKWNNHWIIFVQASCCWIYISKGIEHCYRLIIMDKINQHAKNDGNKNHAKKNLWNYTQQISNDLGHAIIYENKNWNFPKYWLQKSIMSYKNDHESNHLHLDLSMNSLINSWQNIINTNTYHYHV